jgi:hypothetical protein
MIILTKNKKHVEVNGAVSFSEYMSTLEKLVNSKGTSGPDQTEEKISATVINLQRMKRLIKEPLINDELHRKINSLSGKIKWLVITEAWCGDAAQNLPYIQQAANLNKKNIQLLLVFRDENPELMNCFMTHGTRSIPKLVCLNAETNEVICSWGPRPRLIQDRLEKYVMEHPQADKKEKMYQLHLNYFHDKGISLQTELIQLIEETLEFFRQLRFVTNSFVG